ncbi:MAG: hypothetical protein M3Q91_03035 [Acidobacteriota bacterium]|nr:hypothetical protein [Acidobacteriota bacterium]
MAKNRWLFITSTAEQTTGAVQLSRQDRIEVFKNVWKTMQPEAVHIDGNQATTMATTEDRA